MKGNFEQREHNRLCTDSGSVYARFIINLLKQRTLNEYLAQALTHAHRVF